MQDMGSDQPRLRRGPTTRMTPEPRSRSSGGRMKPTYSVLRARRGIDATLETVAADLRSSLPHRDSIRCMNPECSEECTWPAGRGRPARFHDRLCHDRYHLVRGRLVVEIEEIRMALKRTPRPVTDERIYLENQLARRRWLLERYPALHAREGRGSID